MEILWTIKANLIGFELSSSLQVNFSKSRLIGINGINVGFTFLDLASDFLNYYQKLPFQVSWSSSWENPQSEATLEPLVSTMSRHVMSWSHRFVSMWSSATLLNSLMNVIPIFFSSFLKMPLKALNNIVKLQRRLLWDEVYGNDNIPWVSWTNACKPKKIYGFGVHEHSKSSGTIFCMWSKLSWTKLSWSKLLCQMNQELS